MVLSTIQGVITEYGGADVFPTIYDCSLNLEADTAIISMMYESIKQDMRDKTDIVTAWHDFFGMIFGVKDIIFQLNRCKTWDRKSWDSLNLNKSFALAGNPQRYLEIKTDDVLINEVSIAQLAKEGAELARAGNYKEFGRKFATILKLVTAPKPSEQNLFLF